eukprot:TRINITY_DN6395_c0_g1_i1.p1 TRINITY_DN6395_c0_g1~~TRINITY_DN6395_c0_g1_i1.p1  ORF type:complete len:369 (-),score=59.19 TRINITY_DN6395_c0_g1_i1:930-2036(-)
MDGVSQSPKRRCSETPLSELPVEGGAQQKRLRTCGSEEAMCSLGDIEDCDSVLPLGDEPLQEAAVNAMEWPTEYPDVLDLERAASNFATSSSNSLGGDVLYQRDSCQLDTTADFIPPCWDDGLAGLPIGVSENEVGGVAFEGTLAPESSHSALVWAEDALMNEESSGPAVEASLSSLPNSRSILSKLKREFALASDLRCHEDDPGDEFCGPAKSLNDFLSGGADCSPLEEAGAHASLSFLLEASDDQLGIPSSPSGDVQQGSEHLVGPSPCFYDGAVEGLGEDTSSVVDSGSLASFHLAGSVVSDSSCETQDFNYGADLEDHSVVPALVKADKPFGSDLPDFIVAAASADGLEGTAFLELPYGTVFNL